MNNNKISAIPAPTPKGEIFYFTYERIVSHSYDLKESQTLFYNNYKGMIEEMDRYANLPRVEIVDKGVAIWRKSDGKLIPQDKK